MADKNILILCCSARKNGNSETLADAFIEGAKSVGNKIAKINVAEMSIGGCKGCNGCWNSGGNCVFNDDMKTLEPLLESADVLVVATPMYWSVVPAQMKAVMDRIYQYDPVSGGKHLHIPETVLLTCGETENEEDFDMIKNFYKFFAEWNGMKIREVIAVPKVNGKGEILGNPALDRARELGKSF